MHAIVGKYFDGRTGAAQSAELLIDTAGEVTLIVQGESWRCPLASVAISERLGQVPRRCQFSGGGVFETQDNDGLDAALRLARHATRGRLIDLAERHQVLAIAAAIVTMTLAVGFALYGVQPMARLVAWLMPTGVDEAIGSQSLYLLDKALLQPTTLPQSRRQQLYALFTRMTTTIDDGHRYRLELRASKQLRANALALPSGIVILTDDLVKLAENDEELAAVLAHELGHVQGRHALRQLLQSAGVAAMAAAVLGDVSSISSVVSAVPTIIQARNSREFEIEADQAARHWLAANSIPSQRFDDILCRLERGDRTPGESAVKDFLSTHPPTDVRARC